MSMPWYYSQFLGPDTVNEWYWDPFSSTLGPKPTPFYHSPAEVVLQVMIEEGLVTKDSLELDWPGFNDVEPNTPDNVVTVYDTTGVIQARTQPDGEFMRNEGVQIRVRGNTKREAYVKIKSIFDHLSQEVSGNRIVTVETTDGTGTYNLHALCRFGPILFLGRWKPNMNLHILTLNIMATITRLS